jgi:hypothetical protein
MYGVLSFNVLSAASEGGGSCGAEEVVDEHEPEPVPSFTEVRKLNNSFVHTALVNVTNRTF